MGESKLIGANNAPLGDGLIQNILEIFLEYSRKYF